MPIFRAAEATPFETHGSRFLSYVSPRRGGAQLSAWRLEVPANLPGVAHRPTHEEIILVLAGELRLTLDGVPSDLLPGDVALVAANQELQVQAGPDGGVAWVTTTSGLEAITADGSRITPPWAN